MRHSHRDILTTSDINYALRVRNVEVIIITNNQYYLGNNKLKI